MSLSYVGLNIPFIYNKWLSSAAILFSLVQQLNHINAPIFFFPPEDRGGREGKSNSSTDLPTAPGQAFFQGAVHHLTTVPSSGLIVNCR